MAENLLLLLLAFPFCVFSFFQASTAVPIPQFSQNERTEGLGFLSSGLAVGSVMCVALIVMAPLLVGSIFCCRSLRKRRGEMDEPAVDHSNEKFPNEESSVSEPYYESMDSLLLDDKKDDSLQRMFQVPLQKKRNHHLPFKLPVIPVELQKQSSSSRHVAIPAPKLVAAASKLQTTSVSLRHLLRDNPPELSPVLQSDGQDAQDASSSTEGVAGEEELPLTFTASEEMDPLESSQDKEAHWNVSVEDVKEELAFSVMEEDPTKETPYMARAKSLEDLLTSKEPVMVELTQNRRSKISHVVITASAYSSANLVYLEEEESSHSSPQKTPTDAVLDSNSVDDLGRKEAFLNDTSSVSSYVLSGLNSPSSAVDSDQVLINDLMVDDHELLEKDMDGHELLGKDMDGHELMELGVEACGLMEEGVEVMEEGVEVIEEGIEVCGPIQEGVEGCGLTLEGVEGCRLSQEGVESCGLSQESCGLSQEGVEGCGLSQEGCRITLEGSSVSIDSGDSETTSAEEAIDVKQKMMPIATPPPSPPKAKLSLDSSKLGPSLSQSFSTLSTTVFTAAEVLSASLPSPGEDKLGGSLESILDRGTRSPLRPTNTETEMETEIKDDANSITSVQYSVVKRRLRKKKRKASETIMSPPHTPPPLPPQLMTERTDQGEETSQNDQASPNEGTCPNDEASQNDQAGLNDQDDQEDQANLNDQDDQATLDDQASQSEGNDNEIESEATATPEKANLKEEEDIMSTCLRCDCHLPYNPAGGSSTITSLTTTKHQDEPIYHVLEKPLLCKLCLKNERAIYSRGRELPPSPPPPSLPRRDIRRRKDPVYETVEHLKPFISPKEREEEYRVPPLSFGFKLRNSSSSSTDYESIDNKDTSDALDRQPSLLHFKTDSNSSDYESISSFDMGTGSFKKKEKAAEPSLKHSESIDSSHDYETIEYELDNGEHNYAHIPAVDDSDLESPDRPYIPDGATRNKLLKIDSQGYASVLYPQDTDESWEFDCLNQDGRRESDLSDSSNVTVHNIEEAWKHQLAKGYAPLTMQREPPPSFTRTKSAPNSSKPEPQDYEVPLQVVPPPLPPISQRRINLAKQHAVHVCSELKSLVHADDVDKKDRNLLDIPEENGIKRHERNEEASPHGNKANTISSTSLLSVIAEDETSEKAKLRSRVMSVPAYALQNLLVWKN